MGIAERWKDTVPIKMTTDRAIDVILPYFKQNEKVFLAYLFGSRVKDGGISEKDIDIAIYTDKSFSWDEYFNIYSDIALSLGSDRFDLVWLNRADPIVSFEVITQGKLIYYVDLDMASEFESRTRRIYYDYTVYLRNHSQKVG